MDGPMPRVILVDGFTSGTWTLERKGESATLTVQLFARLGKQDISNVTDEGAALLGFAAADAAGHDVRVLPPG